MGKKGKRHTLLELILFVFVLLLFECIFIGGPCLSIVIIAQILHSFKITKQAIADYYGICRKTLSKWIQYLSTSIKFEAYKAARKLTYLHFLIIQLDLGRKEDQHPLTKGAIESKCETRYQTMRECVSLERCGISKETYKKMDIFPPNISRNLVNHFGC